MITMWMMMTVVLFAFILMVEFSDGAGATQGGGHGLKKAVFAGGCFWCMEKPFEELEGVISVRSGYTGGVTANPAYETYGKGGHLEAVEILYDPSHISYEQLLDIFWRQVDPTDPDGQFVDRGSYYATAIFYQDKDQKAIAEKSKETLQNRNIYGKPIVTPILPAGLFYPAEDYHQDYYKNNPVGYQQYRLGSGRDPFLKRIWGKEKMTRKEAELKKRGETHA